MITYRFNRKYLKAFATEAEALEHSLSYDDHVQATIERHVGDGNWELLAESYDGNGKWVPVPTFDANHRYANESTVNPDNGREEWVNSDTGLISCTKCSEAWPDETTTICQSCIDRAAKQAAIRAQEMADAKAFSERLVSVKRIALAKGFRFVGTFTDGSTKVLRGRATRPYTTMALHQHGAQTFHQAAPKPAGSWDVIIRIVPIDA